MFIRHGLFVAVKPIPAVCVACVCRQLFHYLALPFDPSTHDNNWLQWWYLVPSSQPLNPFTPSRSMCAGGSRHACGAPCMSSRWWLKCRLSNREVSFTYIHTCIQSDAAAAACATASLCVAILLLLLQQQCCCSLLLFVIVCWMAKFCCCFTESDPSVLFLFIKTRVSFLHPLAALLCRIYLQSWFAYILGNCGLARSQGGRQPAAAKPPCIYM